jgi:hypothetical protein
MIDAAVGATGRLSLLSCESYVGRKLDCSDGSDFESFARRRRLYSKVRCNPGKMLRLTNEKLI